MGMFSDLHKLDREQQDARTPATPAPRRLRPAVPSSPPPPSAPAPVRPDAGPGSQSAASMSGLPASEPATRPADGARPGAGPPSPNRGPVVPRAPVGPDPTWDLSELPYRKDTFLFTGDEFEALEDLKLSLRRRLDVKVTKNDLARCAIAYMVDEYTRHQEDSPIFTPLRKRRSR